jgi:ATP-dependent RNA helicase DBP3
MSQLEKRKKKEKKNKSEKASKKARIDNNDNVAENQKWVFSQKEKSTSKIAEFLKVNEIRITNLQNQDENVTPILKFSDVSFPALLVQDLARFEKPTFIQSVSWPPLLQGRDLVGIAATGTLFVI